MSKFLAKIRVISEICPIARQFNSVMKSEGGKKSADLLTSSRLQVIIVDISLFPEVIFETVIFFLGQAHE